MPRKLTNQPRTPGVRRESAYTGLLPELYALAQRDADRFGVHVSFVLATAYAQTIGYTEQPDYRTINRPARKLKIVRRKKHAA